MVQFKFWADKIMMALKSVSQYHEHMNGKSISLIFAVKAQYPEIQQFGIQTLQLSDKMTQKLAFLGVFQGLGTLPRL